MLLVHAVFYVQSTKNFSPGRKESSNNSSPGQKESSNNFFQGRKKVAKTFLQGEKKVSKTFLLKESSIFFLCGQRKVAILFPREKRKQHKTSSGAKRKYQYCSYIAKKSPNIRRRSQKHCFLLETICYLLITMKKSWKRDAIAFSLLFRRAKKLILSL